MVKTTMRGKGQQKGGKKMVYTILGILAAIIILLVAVIVLNSNKNVKAMNTCVEAVLGKLGENYTVTRLEAGDYEELKLNALMKFKVEQYDIEDLGNLSVMKVNMGFMQMATVVITPREKNMPLLSADYMYIMGNRKAYLEFYDVVKEKDAQYNELLNVLADAKNHWEHLENITPSEAWYKHLLTVTTYKAGKADADQDLQDMLVESLGIYLDKAKEFPMLTEEEKQEKIVITRDYTNGLIEKGGISTDVFKKSLGDEVTRDFFDKVFFGTMMQ